MGHGHGHGQAASDGGESRERGAEVDCRIPYFMATYIVLPYPHRLGWSPQAPPRMATTPTPTPPPGATRALGFLAAARGVRV